MKRKGSMDSSEFFAIAALATAIFLVFIWTVSNVFSVSVKNQKIQLVENIENQIAFISSQNPIEIKGDEVVPEIKDGYYIITDQINKPLEDIFKNSEVLVYSRDTNNKIHFVKINDSEYIDKEVYKGEISFTEFKVSNEKENLYKSKGE